jgi:hypothetical protein
MFKPLKILRAEADGLASWKPIGGQLELGCHGEDINRSWLRPHNVARWFRSKCSCVEFFGTGLPGRTGMGVMWREREKHAEESTWPIYTNYFAAGHEQDMGML